VVNISAQDWKTFADGVEYARVRRDFSGMPVDINLLRLDLKKVRLDVHHALDRAIGLETTSSIAKRKGAIAAINAGFFRLDRTEFAGDMAGILVVDGNVWSESHNDRIAIRIMNGDTRTEVWFDHLLTETRLWHDSNFLQLSGINRQRNANEMVAYTPTFGESTLTDSLGSEIVFRNCTGVLRCGIVVNEKGGNSPIPKDGFVLSIGSNLSKDATRLIELLKSNRDPFETRIRLASELTGRPRFRIGKTEDITNGVPQLIKNGKIDITWEQEKASKSFVETRHPRTAVAKLKGGKFLMLTADGRSKQSAGLDLYDLAEYMLELGAVDAMNLDGGGSTTMFLDGKVVNNPSDRDGERKVGDAILVTLRKPKRK
jgi:hypothetical protein